MIAFKILLLSIVLASVNGYPQTYNTIREGEIDLTSETGKYLQKYKDEFEKRYDISNQGTLNAAGLTGLSTQSAGLSGQGYKTSSYGGFGQDAYSQALNNYNLGQQGAAFGQGYQDSFAAQNYLSNQGAAVGQASFGQGSLEQSSLGQGLLSQGTYQQGDYNLGSLGSYNQGSFQQQAASNYKPFRGFRLSSYKHNGEDEESMFDIDSLLFRR